MSSDRIRRSLDAGTSVLVGTVSGRGVPSCCRGYALRSDDDLATATVYVPVATSQQTIANIATTHRVAVMVSHPIDHCTVQIKGTTSAARLARNDEEPFVAARLDAYASVLAHIGLPRRVTRQLAYWPAFAIELSVEEIFEQTPGPRAGSRVR